MPIEFNLYEIDIHGTDAHPKRNESQEGKILGLTSVKLLCLYVII